MLQETGIAEHAFLAAAIDQTPDSVVGCESLYRNPKSWRESIVLKDRERAPEMFRKQVRKKAWKLSFAFGARAEGEIDPEPGISHLRPEGD
jgi:hypothetical protein